MDWTQKLIKLITHYYNNQSSFTFCPSSCLELVVAAVVVHLSFSYLQLAKKVLVLVWDSLISLVSSNVIQDWELDEQLPKKGLSLQLNISIWLIDDNTLNEFRHRLFASYILVHFEQ
jgi:hypothetical protein